MHNGEYVADFYKASVLEEADHLLGKQPVFWQQPFPRSSGEKLSGVCFRLMHDSSLLWIFDILEVICHIFPSTQNKQPLPCAGQGGVGRGGSLSFGCDMLSSQYCVPLLCCCSLIYTLLSVTPLSSRLDGPSSHLPAI